MKHKAIYSFMLSCNASPRGWRDRLGQWLRVWADLLDGRRTMAMRLESNPPVSIAVQTDVLRKGVEHMTRLFRDAVATECTEGLPKKAAPHLFDDSNDF